MIKVWTDAAETGLLDRHSERGSTFVLLAGRARRGVRCPSRCRCGSPHGVCPSACLPFFEMNLPEGFSARTAPACFCESHRHF